MKMSITALLLAGCISCSMLADFAMSSLSPSKGGINTELVVGDKEQVVGSNQDVRASSVGKVVGNSDNSTAVASAEKVQINNNAIPVWVIAALCFMTLMVGWLAPRPAIWKRMINRKTQ